jgi:FSR family fosmidomycin resistance protein-like MFS transporter
MLNDINQSMLVGVYPMLKSSLNLSFTQIGGITTAYQITASMLQPAVGLYTDKKPLYRSLSVAQLFTVIGLVLFALTDNYWLLVAASMLVGSGSAVFHPESSRVARLASGGRHGLAQSLFQVGGNFGASLGPLLAAFIVLARGRTTVAWFSLMALTTSLILWQVGRWYRDHDRRAAAHRPGPGAPAFGQRRTLGALAVLIALVASNNVYIVSFSSFYIFYLMEAFHLAIRDAQICLFVFLGGVAVGTVAGGPVGDRIGRKLVIWISVLGVLPFTVALPYAGLPATIALSVVIGLILGSSFSHIVVFGQELVPGRVGLIAGMFFGFAFGAAGIGAIGLGILADHTSIRLVYHLCSYLPLTGLLAAFLPDLREKRPGSGAAAPGKAEALVPETTP